LPKDLVEEANIICDLINHYQDMRPFKYYEKNQQLQHKDGVETLKKPRKLAVPRLGIRDANPIEEFPTPRSYEPTKPRN
jgi:hypothetical protein